MMDSFCLMTDSSCDLTDELARELNLCVVPLSVHMGGKTYRNYLDGREISFHDFYDAVRGGEMPTSSAVSVGDFEAEMEQHLTAGEDVLCIAFSSALSSTYQSASIAADHLRERYPNRRVDVIDSLLASGGHGLLLYLCAKEREAGKSIEEVRAFAEETKHKICSWFTVEDLNHLKRGGRISAATALFGTMLAIKPILKVDEYGKLVSVDKVRGRRASLTALVERTASNAVHPETQTVFVTHGDCPEEAETLAEELRRRVGFRDIRISYVGPVIGAHTGPGVLTVFYLGKA